MCTTVFSEASKRNIQMWKNSRTRRKMHPEQAQSSSPEQKHTGQSHAGIRWRVVFGRNGLHIVAGL